MWPVNPRRLISAIALGLALCVAAPAAAASLLDPSLRFRTIETDHFVIYFHQGEDRLAGRLATIAEQVWRRVGEALKVAAPRRTHVILADQTELANGWATPIPYNTVFVTAAAPAGSEFIGREDDWLRLVFTHEFTHIVHLDRSEGWARVFRGVFGRTPIAFPNLWLPGWQIEGLATFEESQLTGGRQGRLNAGDFRAIEDEAARAGRLDPIDRANGGLTDWPGGNAAYAYGSGFHEYLATRFGEERLGALADATARSLPFLGSREFPGVFGQPLGALWKEYQAQVSNRASTSPVASLRPSTQLTHAGFTVLAPRFAPRACDTCAAEIVYSMRGPDGFPTLNAVPVTGGPSRRLTRRYLGSTSSATRDLVVFDQQEIRRNAGVYSDLYAFDRKTGRTYALTRDSRLQDPDLSPDGRRIVSVREAAGTRDLIVIDITSAGESIPTTLGTPRVLVSEAGTQFNAPRWAPDGRSIAVARQRLGSWSELVVVDATTGAVRIVASDPNARIVTPAWHPDGRSIVAAADFDGGSFNLFEFDASVRGSAAKQLTATSGGASWPDVSSDGATLAYVGYTAAGFDVFTTPLEPTGVIRTLVEPETKRPADNEPSPALTPRRYLPWRTLAPTTWAPLLEAGSDQVRFGATTGGADVLGRHAYAVAASWLISNSVPTSAPRGEPDWAVSYVYDQQRPVLFASASLDTTLIRRFEDDIGLDLPDTIRDRELQAGVLFPVRHARTTRRLLASMVREVDEYYYAASDSVRRHRTSARFGAGITTAHRYGYSVSAEEGVDLGATTEVTREALGSDGDATTSTFDARAYLPGFGRHHVVALRGAAGASLGSRGFVRPFFLGGSGSGDVLSFDDEAFELLRGFPPQEFAGTHIATVNADYRWPIARPQRGVGTWPLLVHTVHAAIAVDAGNVWTGQFDGSRIKTSLAGELSLDLVAGYSFPFTLTVGGGVGRDGATDQQRGTVFVRVGRAF